MFLEFFTLGATRALYEARDAEPPPCAAARFESESNGIIQLACKWGRDGSYLDIYVCQWLTCELLVQLAPGSFEANPTMPMRALEASPVRTAK